MSDDTPPSDVGSDESDDSIELGRGTTPAVGIFDEFTSPILNASALIPEIPTSPFSHNLPKQTPDSLEIKFCRRKVKYTYSKRTNAGALFDAAFDSQNMPSAKKKLTESNAKHTSTPIRRDKERLSLKDTPEVSSVGVDTCSSSLFGAARVTRHVISSQLAPSSPSDQSEEGVWSRDESSFIKEHSLAKDNVLRRAGSAEDLSYKWIYEHKQRTRSASC